MSTTIISKTDMLHKIAKDYVEKGLGGRNFDAIPYDDNVSLRAPICPGGSATPLIGKENLRSIWWTPLPTLIGGVKVIDSFVNKDKKSVAIEFHCQIINPACTLRIVDKFIINEEGKITEQENFFDPRDITNPGWQG